MTNQPKHGAKIRKSEGNHRPVRLHVAHTLANGTGASFGRSAEFSGSGGITLDSMASCLSVSNAEERPVGHARQIYPDRARDLGRIDT